MQIIKLTQNKIALVDDIDFDWLNQWKWYASRTIIVNGSQKHCLMHRFILNAPMEIKVDHKNNDGLDNQRHNIRFCTDSQNNQNRHSAWGVSVFKGVYWHKMGSKWAAKIRLNNKNIHLGLFSNELDAARSYNEAAIKYFGNFAHINNLYKAETSEPASR